MRALAILLLLCAGLIGLASWQAHEAGPAGLLVGALAGAWRLWRSQ